MPYAFITRIKNLKKHSNADRLMVGECFGNQVIVSVDTKENDIGVYFAVDSQLSEEFCRANNLIRIIDENGNNVGGYLDPNKRNIRALKLRGEISDGLFLPLSSLSNFTDIGLLKTGDCVDVLDGDVICQKYIPKRKSISSSKIGKHNNKINLLTYPFFEEHKDTAQYVFNRHRFKKGDIVTISLKMHGTSGRTSYTTQRKLLKPTWYNKVFVKCGIKNPFKDVTKTVSGTRRVILSDFKGGYYGNDEFRKKYHDFFDGKLMAGETVYYEIVGYVEENKSIMPSCDNRKTKDKNFIKKYGERTLFHYGCPNGENEIYVYRMTFISPTGQLFEYPTWLVQKRCEKMGVLMVPILKQMIFEDIDTLNQDVDSLVFGEDPIGKTHIREGVVIRIENRNEFTAFKHKSFEFKLLEGIIKDAGVMDIEEIESIFGENDELK